MFHLFLTSRLAGSFRVFGFVFFWVGWVCLGVCLLVASFLKFPRSFASFPAGKFFNRIRVAMTDNAQSLIGTGTKKTLFEAVFVLCLVFMDFATLP